MAAGLDAERLVEGALAAHDPHWQPLADDAAAARARVALAAAASLLTDSALRGAVARGAALLTFAHVAVALGGRPGDDAEGEAAAALGVPALLRGRVLQRAAEAATGAAALEGKAEAEASLSLAALAGDGAAATAAGAAAGLLPAALMLSAPCRALQARLLVLQVRFCCARAHLPRAGNEPACRLVKGCDCCWRSQDTRSLRHELPLLTQATVALALSSLAGEPGSGDDALLRQAAWLPRLRRLRAPLHAHADHAARSTSRPLASPAAQQQLCWLVDALLPAAPGARAPSPNAMGYALGRVLPALVSELWLAWHRDVWACSAAAPGQALLRLQHASGSAAGGAGAATASAPFLRAGGAGGAPRGGAVPEQHVPARLLGGAALSAAAAAVVLDCSGSVQDRAARVAQLRLSATHLLLDAAASGAPVAEPAVAAAAARAPAWPALAALTCHALWAHRSAVADDAARRRLGELLRGAVAQALGEGAAHGGGGAWVDEAVRLLAERCAHAPLRALLEGVVRPLLDAVAAGSAAGEARHQVGAWLRSWCAANQRR